MKTWDNSMSRKKYNKKDNISQRIIETEAGGSKRHLCALPHPKRMSLIKNASRTGKLFGSALDELKRLLCNQSYMISSVASRIKNYSRAGRDGLEMITNAANRGNTHIRVKIYGLAALSV